MMKTRLGLIVSVIVICLMKTLPTNAGGYGLRIKSHSVPGKERTTLDLLGGDPIEMGGVMKLSFTVDIRNEPVFGYIMYMPFDNGRYISLLVTPGEDNFTYYPTVMIDDKSYNIPYKLKNPSPVDDIPVSITLDRQKNVVMASFGGKQRKIAVDLSLFTKSSVSFGCQMAKGRGADVVPVDIRDIKVERDGKPLYSWDLRQHDGDVTTDMVTGRKAVAINGYWLLDNHSQWRMAFQGQYASGMQFTYNSRLHTLYIINDDSLTCWNAATGSARVTPVKGRRVMPKSKYLYSDESNGMLYSYNLEKRSMTEMNPEEGVWKNDIENTEDAIYYNHAMASRGGDTLFTFGGYGFYRFRKNLHMVNMGTGEITELKVKDGPTPRTNAGMAWVGNKLYIFGGYGNESGKQELSGNFYHDLWEIDITTMKATKLWDIDSDYRMSVASRLMYNPEERAFYAATMNKELVRFCAEKPGWQVVTRRMPVQFAFDLLNYDMFFDSGLGRIIVVVDRFIDSVHNLSVFTIDMPLMVDTAGEAEADNDVTDMHGINFITTGVILLLLAAVAGVVSSIILRRRKAANRNSAPFKPEENILYPAQTIPALDIQPDRNVSEIRVLGEFAAFDRQGCDITSKFSSRSRDLLFVLLLSSTIRAKGIESRQLDEILWEDKTKISARNNRNVYMRKLRVLLDEIGDIDITSDKINYKATVGDDVAFDFGEANRLMDIIGGGDVSEELVNRLIGLLLRGPLLPTQSLVWLDDLKGEYSRRAISLLKSLAIRATNQENDTQLYHIAEAIMAHDPFNEEALAIQCRILCKRQAIGIAKHVYNKFCKIYEQSMGETYDKSFNEICRE